MFYRYLEIISISSVYWLILMSVEGIFCPQYSPYWCNPNTTPYTLGLGTLLTVFVIIPIIFIVGEKISRTFFRGLRCGIEKIINFLEEHKW